MKAQADAQNALNINKNCAVGYVRLAQVSMYEGKWSDAIVILEMGSRLEPLNEEITNLLQECNDKESQQKKEKEQKKELGKSQTATKKKESPQKNKNLAMYATQQKSGSQCSTSSKKVPAPKKVQLKANTTSTNQQSTCISTWGSKQFWCSLCQVPLDGKPSVQQHLRGKAHSAKIKT
eukprot:PhF_6_TR27035/c0_g1_i3/m.39487